MTSRVGWAYLLVLLPGLLGCAPQPAGERPAEFETEDIGPAPDADIDLSADQRAAPRRAASGQLPGDFPAGMPVYQGASISDIGEGGLGGMVQFAANARPESVRSWYQSALPRSGWVVETSPDGGIVASKGASRARITVEAAGSASTITVVY